MREIKFRAWDKRNEKWFHPSLFILTTAGFYEDFREFDDGNALFDYEYELMQYTGLKDKNGREIYEGDIVDGVRESHWHDGLDLVLCKVVYSDLKACYTLEGNGAGEICNVLDIEVIGNIYENPELIDAQ